MPHNKSNIFNKFFFTLGFITIQLFSHGQFFDFEPNTSIIVNKLGTQLKHAFSGGINSGQFSTIDANLDGIEDLFIFDRNSNTVSIFINSGIEYSFDPGLSASFPLMYSWAMCRDYNNDGKKDLMHYESGGIAVWKNVSTNDSLLFERITFPIIYSKYYQNLSNLYVGSPDIPAITDIDFDGDLDVLTFSLMGSQIEYHKNLSQENGYGNDSLIFEMFNACWGHFSETGLATNTCVLYDTCSLNVDQPEIPLIENRQTRHTGSTLLSINLNDDNNMDLLLGDVSFNNCIALISDDNGPNQNSSMIAQDTTFPSYDIPIDLTTFPAFFYEDLDFDGIKDLIVSPNLRIKAADQSSVWYYKNNGSNSSPQFTLVQKNKLQDEMIDYGTDAYPLFFDYDNDGLMDLVIGSLGVYDPNLSLQYTSRLSLWKNVGTTQSPEFTWITDDFGNVGNYEMGIGLFPALGDIDNDGDVDLFIGEYEGKIWFLKNLSNQTSVYTFDNPVLVQDSQGSIIDVGFGAKPQLFDLDKDGKSDLLIGTQSGKIHYYRNTGTGSFLFTKITEQLGMVATNDPWSNTGNASPCFIRNSDGITHLYVGAINGRVLHFNNIDNNLNGTFQMTLSYVGNIWTGSNAAPTLAHLTGDTIPELICGTSRGGVLFFEGKNPNNTGVPINLQEPIKFYPNPTDKIIFLKTFVTNEVNYYIYDCLGKPCLKGLTEAQQIDVSNLKPGIYIIQLNNQTFQKFIKR